MHPRFVPNVVRFAFIILGGTQLLQAADFPAIYNSESDTDARPLSAQESLLRLKLPAGFKATVFAAEPAVQNPIAMTWDSRGRLWIAENYTYAEPSKKYDLQLRDRILIFEDRDGDGRFDERTVFTENLQRLISIEVGLGGVWALCPPTLLFIPDRNADGVPDGNAQVVLDGFSIPEANYHTLANGLRWGLDGWLYGRCGASSPADIGAPGTPAELRAPVRGGMWRYHPRRKIAEALVSGTTNPWGHDWDQHGELFFINTVNGHLWHMIPGAHFVRPHTIEPNPRAYEVIDMHADHWHFDTKKGWTASRHGAANDYGGGHAHCGAMIYLGDNWPSEYRDRLFTLNLHGRLVNQENLEREGSGYVARHGRDQFLFGDPWFRGLEIGYGPDGGVFVLDWSDTDECHEATGVHRTSGRIYKITYGDAKRPGIGDLAEFDISKLVNLHLHENEWFTRQARLQLIDRATTGKNFNDAKKQLLDLYSQRNDTPTKLRALWSLYAIGAADEKLLRAELRNRDEHIRTWAIRLLTDYWPLDSVMSVRPAPSANEIPAANALLPQFRRMAKEDRSALVRLAVATVLQRLPVSNRVELAAPLLAHAKDANDHNLPLMIWYGLIPVADVAPGSLAQLSSKCELPMTRKFIARRLTEDIESNPPPLNTLLKSALDSPEKFQLDTLTGMTEALRGWQKAKKPSAWDALQTKLSASANPELRERVRDLAVVFGDGRALDEVKRIALDDKADLAARRAALQSLIAARPPDLRAICEKLMRVRNLGAVAIRGLTSFDDPAIAERLAGSYRQFQPPERRAVIEALVSRRSFAGALLDEMAAQRIPRADLTPFDARQFRSLNDAALTKRLEEVWGVERESSAEKRRFIADVKSKLTPAFLQSADKVRGRSIFTNACANCHVLYGEGGQVGPDLTGAGRDNLDYLLENIVDPSAMVSADFRMTVVELKDGRTINGLLSARTDRTITLKTQTDTITVERKDIEAMQDSSLSIMPEGLLDLLDERQRRDLLAFLMSKNP